MQTRLSMVPPGFQLPGFEHLFATAHVHSASADENKGAPKLAGTGDSGGKRSSQKAPGGKDSRQQKDGG